MGVCVWTEEADEGQEKRYDACALLLWIYIGPIWSHRSNLERNQARFSPAAWSALPDFHVLPGNSCANGYGSRHLGVLPPLY